jgi:hypothetical protein
MSTRWPFPSPLRPQDLIEIVVLAAVEHSGSLPAVVRPWLHAVFKRARELGLSMEAAEEAMRSSVSAEKQEAVPKAEKKRGSAR